VTDGHLNADTLAATLDTPSGFTSVMRGMFRNGKGKRSHAIWSSAQRKGVHELVELRFATHDSYGYAVLAFSDQGRLDLRLRETLAEQADRFPFAKVRYESVTYSALMPLGGRTIEAIADPYPGVHAFTAVTSPKGSDRPLVAHCVLDGTDFVYPIPGDVIDA
jgi:hypothetical protein